MSRKTKASAGSIRAEIFRKKLYAFAGLFEQHHNERLSRFSPGVPIEEVGIEEGGYKFCKVFIDNGNNTGRYMVELATENIYGVKSWTQVNLRRMYGNLDTVDQFEWSEEQARPMPGTPAEQEFYAREDEIRKEYKKRGRKSKSARLAVALGSSR